MSRPVVMTPDFKLNLGEQDLSVMPLKKRVSEITVDQVANGAAWFKIILDDCDGEFSNGSHKISEGDSCIIQLGYANTEIKKLLEGIVTGVSTKRAEGGRTYFVVTGFDGMQALTRGRKRRSWEQIKDSDIAGIIANECGLQPDVDDSGIVHSYLAQNDITNLKFLQERAKRFGFELKVEEKRLVFKKPNFSSEPYVLHYNSSKADENSGLVFHCDINTSTMGVVKQVTVRWRSAKTDSPIIGIAKTVSNNDTESILPGSDAAQKNNPDTSIQISDIPVESQEEAEAVAQAALDRLASEYIKGTAKGEGNPNIVAGKRVKILDIGKELEGVYYVTSATHTYKVGGRNGCGYLTEFTVNRTSR